MASDVFGQLAAVSGRHWVERTARVLALCDGARVLFPANATNGALPLVHAGTVILTNWPSGPWVAEWYNPATAVSLGLSEANAGNHALVLPMPDFTEDSAARLYPPPQLTPEGFDSTNGFRLRLDSETGGPLRDSGIIQSGCLGVDPDRHQHHWNQPAGGSACRDPRAVFFSRRNGRLTLTGHPGD